MGTNFKTSDTNCTDIERLNEQYKKSCLDSTKRDLNSIINNYIDDETIDSDHKQKIIDMIVTLLTLK